MTQFWEYVKMALDHIRTNKGRSFLTMLGIIIGITSVVTIVSIGNGLKKNVIDANNEQNNTAVVLTNPEEVTKTDIITNEDIEYIRNAMGDRMKNISSSSAAFGKATTRKGGFDATVTFTTSGYEGAQFTAPIIRGHYFTDHDVAYSTAVCVIDELAATYLFGNKDVIGMNFDVTIDNQIVTVTVVGIRETSESTLQYAAMMEQLGLDKSISVLEMPYTVSKDFGEPIEGFSSVSLQANEQSDTHSMASAVVNILNTRHQDAGEKPFMQQKPIDFGNLLGPIMDGVTAFVALVASISLVVGGIGVMNIMLVSVTERTREIGIRKALGAKTGSIVAQFLCESAIISGIGGVIGIILGGLLTLIINALNVMGGARASLSLPAIIVATLFSCGVGIVFGIYPARKAARMSPIEALRRMS